MKKYKIFVINAYFFRGWIILFVNRREIGIDKKYVQVGPNVLLKHSFFEVFLY